MNLAENSGHILCNWQQALARGERPAHEHSSKRHGRQQELDELSDEILAEQALLLTQMGEADRAACNIMAKRDAHVTLGVHKHKLHGSLHGKVALEAVNTFLQNATKKSCKYGFVSFNNLRSATVARQVLHDSHVLGRFFPLFLRFSIGKMQKLPPFS